MKKSALKYCILFFLTVFGLSKIKSQDLTGYWLLQNELNYIEQKEYDTTFFQYTKLLLEKDVGRVVDTMSLLQFDESGVFNYCAITERVQEPVDTVDNNLILTFIWEEECLSQYDFKTWRYNCDSSRLFIYLNQPKFENIFRQKLEYTVEFIDSTKAELTRIK